jgi:hypothetical protein
MEEQYLVSVFILGENMQSFIIKDDAGHGFFIDRLYQVEEVTFCS